MVLGAGVALVAAAVFVVLLTRGDDTSGASFPAAAASRRIAIGPTSQADLLAKTALDVRVRLPAGSKGTVQAQLAAAGEDPWPVTQAVTIRGSGTQPVRLPVLDDAAPRLRSCRARQLSVSLRQGGGGRVVRRTRMLAVVPPRCGRFFGRGSVWTTPIASSTPVDKLSTPLVAGLAAEVRAEFARNFPPTINTTSFSSPVYTVPARQRRIPVRLVGPRVAYGGDLKATLARGVPLPAHAKVAAGTDKHIVVWQPATDTMWELWIAENHNGTWTAQWGGKMTGVSRSRGYFSDPSGIQPGATATSLPLVGGMITQADLARGEINHALAMAIPNSRYAVWAYPAQRSDGGNRSPTAIPQGARFRLDPGVDVDSLAAPSFTKMIARAAQRYGIYVRDTSPVVTLYAQDPSNLGANAWPASITPSPAAVLQAFPWDRLQVTPMHLFTYSGKSVPH